MSTRPSSITRLRDRLRKTKDAADAKVTQLRQRHESVDFCFAVLHHDRVTGGALLAGALAFRLFLWLLPAMLVVVGGLGFVPPAQAGRAAADSGLGTFTADTIREASEEVHRARWVVVIIGLVLLYIASAALARALVAASALEWQLPIPSLRVPRAAVLVVAFVGVAVALALIANWLRSHTSPLGITATVVLVVIWTALTWVLSWALPKAPGTPRLHLLPGAVLVGVGMQVLHLVTIFYLVPKLSSSSKLYGALGGAATLLLWAYLIARLFIASSAVNRTFALRTQHDEVRPTD